MEIFSPKLEIINHFDDLIQKVDIDIEEKIEKYNENQLLGELQCLKDENLRIEVDYKFRIEFCESSDENKEQTVGQWSESTKVVDYLNQIRMTTIEELRKEQKESVENSSHFNSLINSELKKEEKRSELFAEKFYFQVKITTEDIKPWVFNLFTLVTDFYISQSDIDLLEKLINAQLTNETNLSLNHIFDEKMILICLLYKYFCDNINNNKFPNHVIQVFKNDVSKIEQIDVSLNISSIELNSFSIDLSKLTNLSIETQTALDYITIDSLYSLEYLRLKFTSVNEMSIKNLYQLKELYIFSKEIINLKTDLFDHLPNIERLSYWIYSMNELMKKFEFNKLEKSIKFYRNSNTNDLNVDLFMNKFNIQIEKLEIEESNIENITWILSHYHFPTLIHLSISCCDITRIEGKFFNALPPMIQILEINDNKKLNIIDHDVFSNFKQLDYLVLCHNSIESLDRRHFTNLINLKGLFLRSNRLKRLDDNIFSDLKNLKRLVLSQNQLEALEANTLIGLDNLNELDLYKNNVKIIHHEAFSNFKQLVCLNLSENYIESLDRRHFSNLFNLERLDLSHNELKLLDEYIFSDLKNLKKLDLSSNNIENIDSGAFSKMKQLEYLDLSNNSIESLDKRVFSGLVNLERLYLGRNRLKMLDENIFSDLKSLKMVDLGHNQLETLEANTFASLENLNQLYLNNNELKIIHHEAFLNLKHLVLLNLDYNSIESLDRRVFSGLVNLEELYLQENLLKRFDENIFSDLKNLERLYLWNNQLEILDVNSFVGLDNLKFLELTLNKLKHFDVRIFDNLPRLGYIYLSGNEISNIDEIKETLNLCKRKTIFYF